MLIVISDFLTDSHNMAWTYILRFIECHELKTIFLSVLTLCELHVILLKYTFPIFIHK